MWTPKYSTHALTYARLCAPTYSEYFRKKKMFFPVSSSFHVDKTHIKFMFFPLKIAKEPKQNFLLFLNSRAQGERGGERGGGGCADAMQ